jgi:DNA polymerase-3 subunit alpha
MSANRAALLADLDRAMGEAQLRRKDREVGQSSLFDMMGGGEEEAPSDFGPESKIEVPEMGDLEKLKLEKELLGFFLSGHPVDTLGGLGQKFDSSNYEEIMKTQFPDLWSSFRY